MIHELECDLLESAYAVESGNYINYIRPHLSYLMTEICSAKLIYKGIS